MMLPFRVGMLFLVILGLLATPLTTLLSIGLKTWVYSKLIHEIPNWVMP